MFTDKKPVGNRLGIPAHIPYKGKIRVVEDEIVLRTEREDQFVGLTVRFEEELQVAPVQQADGAALHGEKLRDIGSRQYIFPVFGIYAQEAVTLPIVNLTQRCVTGELDSIRCVRGCAAHPECRRHQYV